MSPAMLKYALCACMAMALGGCMHARSIVQPAAGSGASATAAQATSTSAPDLSLSTIVDRDLQHGRYADGEAELRRYLQKHPDDRTAQSLLTQATADPSKMLGPAVHTHTVQAGESYSTLAAQYLGNGDLFLILARYNNAGNPSLLRVGAVIQLPAPPAKTIGFAGAEGAAESTTAAAGKPSAVASATSESSVQKAQFLEAESIQRYRQGDKPQALALLDQALTLDPSLPPSGPVSLAMRKELAASYHQRAIVLYRDQHLDEAIALWDRVLAIEPDFEPAVVYRARAVELKQRLKQY